MAIQKYELANGGVNFHGKHPGQSPKGPALPLDGFYPARSPNTAPLQWQSFSPPRTQLSLVNPDTQNTIAGNASWSAEGY